MTSEAAQTKNSAAGRGPRRLTKVLELRRRRERRAFLRGLRKDSAAAGGGGLFCVFRAAAQTGASSGRSRAAVSSLSWKLHPDNFVRAGEYERGLSLERSSQLNDAYRTLREPVEPRGIFVGAAGARARVSTSSRRRRNCWRRFSS